MRDSVPSASYSMYCVNGASRSSLLIESTDSMIESTDSMILYYKNYIKINVVTVQCANVTGSMKLRRDQCARVGIIIICISYNTLPEGYSAYTCI